MRFNPGFQARLFDAGRFRTIYKFAGRTPGWGASMIVSEGTGFRVVCLKNHQIENVINALRLRGFEVRTELVPARLWWSIGRFADFLRREGKLSSKMEEI